MLNRRKLRASVSQEFARVVAGELRLRIWKINGILQKQKTKIGGMDKIPSWYREP